MPPFPANTSESHKSGVPQVSPLRPGHHKSWRGTVFAFGVVISAEVLLLSVALSAIAQAQSPLFNSKPTPKAPPAVSYLFPEQLSIPANKPTAVDLHFRVADGLHINSHIPSEEGLIPTTLAVPESSGVRLAKADFPPGSNFTLSIPSEKEPQEKLSVYTGEFTIHAQLVAAPGDHLVEATLRYQACNNTQCMPPRSIPVAIDVIAK